MPEEICLKGVLDKRMTHYFCRTDPPIIGVRLLVAKLRLEYFAQGTEHAGDCQLTWCQHGDEEWVIVSIAAKHEAMMLGVTQGISLRCVSGAPFPVPGLDPESRAKTIGYAAGHPFHPETSKDFSLQKALREEEEEAFVAMLRRRK